MPPIARNILAVVVGVVFGSMINMAIIFAGPRIIPLPDGVTMENIAITMDQWKPLNFMVPYVAHALGTLAGAYVAARMAASRQMGIAIGIAVVFLLGGIGMIISLGGPMWFKALDLLTAYIPMGYLGCKLGKRRVAVSPIEPPPGA